MKGESYEMTSAEGAIGAILVVEDSLEYIQGLERYFRGTYQLRSATTVAAAKKLLSGPDHFVGAIVDVKLLDGSGIEVVASIRRRGLTFPVLVVTAFFEEEHAAAAQYHGAEFLPKGAEEPKHLEAFSRRIRDHAGFARSKDQLLIQRLARAHRLTQRETEIIAMTIADVPRAEMATHLGISPDTLKSHVRSVLRKTQSRSIAELGGQLRRMLRGDLPDDGS